MDNNNFVLPDKIILDDFNGDFTDFYEAVYEIFKRDFISSKPIFRGKRLVLKKYPIRDGKEATFYHMVTSGSNEDSRIPDLRRCERIAWAKPSIENCDTWSLKVWPQKRNGKNRICIWLECKDNRDYIVILDIRKDFALPWTTFTLNYEHEKRKKFKEYQNYLKSKNRTK